MVSNESEAERTLNGSDRFSDTVTSCHSRENGTRRDTCPAQERDIDLALRATRGELDAFEALYHRHHRGARSIAMRVLRCPALAEDCVAEVFHHLLTHGWGVTPEATPPSGRLDAFVATVTRQMALRMRYHGRLVERRSVSTDDDDNPVKLHSTFPTPEAHLLRLEVRARVLAAVRGLTPRLREAAYWRFVREKSIADVERRLGLTPGSGPVYLNRARRELRVALADIVDVPPPGRAGRRRMRYAHEDAR